MYELNIHTDAKADLDRIWREDPRQWARIQAMLEELDDDCELRLWMAVPDAVVGRIDVEFFKELQRQGVEVWRLKFRDVGGVVPYRLLYAFDDEEERCYILAVMHRGQNYGADKNLVRRLTAAYNQLGLPRKGR